MDHFKWFGVMFFKVSVRLQNSSTSHLSIPLFAQLIFLLLGQIPHGHVQQVIVVWSTVVLFCFLLSILFLNFILKRVNITLCYFAQLPN